MSAAILGEPHALDALLALGWEVSPSAACDVLTAQRVFTMADVRLVEDAKDALKKAQRDALTKTVRSTWHAGDPRGSWGNCCAACSCICSLEQERPQLPSSPRYIGQQMQCTTYTVGYET